MANICGVCRLDTADLISLKCQAESERILYKLKNFIDPKVSISKSKYEFSRTFSRNGADKVDIFQ